jgi:Protein of unknown function (DUF1232)
MVARFVPDCVILFGRLLRDPRVPRRRKLLLAALIPYLAMPFDLVPDFIAIEAPIHRRPMSRRYARNVIGNVRSALETKARAG